MKKLLPLLIGIIVLIGLSCQPETGEFPDEIEELPDSLGILEIEFVIPDYKIPEKKIHLVDLSVATTFYTAFREEFVAKANVSDQKLIYQFRLSPGTYVYQAVITCSCGGDTCLYGGFPGGQFGLKYDFNEIQVEAGRTRHINTMFQ